jgi:hypothetical protein
MPHRPMSPLPMASRKYPSSPCAAGVWVWVCGCVWVCTGGRAPSSGGAAPPAQSLGRGQQGARAVPGQAQARAAPEQAPEQAQAQAQRRTQPPPHEFLTSQ